MTSVSGVKGILGNGRDHDGAPAPAVLVFLLCAAAFTSSWTGFRVAGVNLADLFTGAALVSSVAYGLSGRRSLLVPWQFVVLPAVVVALMARDAFVFDRLPFQALTAAEYTSGVSLGETVGGSATFLLRLILCWTAIGVATSLVRGSVGHLVIVCGAWVSGTAVSVYWAIAQSVFGLPDLPFIYHIDSLTRAVGLANHPNSFAETIGTALPIAVFVATGSRTRPLLRVLGCVTAAAFVGALFLSGSRAGIALGLGALVASVLVRLIWSGRAVWAVPIGLLSVVAGILWLPQVWATTRFAQDAAQVSDSARLAALRQGLDLFASHPVGGSGLSIWLGEMVPLILLSGGGLLLFTAFYWSLGSVILHVWRARRQEFIAQLVCSCAVVIVFGLLNNGLVERYLYWPLVVGFYLARAARDQSASGDAHRNEECS